MQVHITYYSGDTEIIYGVKKFDFFGDDGHAIVFFEGDIITNLYKVDFVSVKEG